MIKINDQDDHVIRIEIPRTKKIVIKNYTSKLRNIESKFERVKTVLTEKRFIYRSVNARYYLGMAVALNP